MKTKWTPLMEGYEVETCVTLPIKDGEADYDAAEYRRFDFRLSALAAAKQKAKELLPNDKFGAVTINEFHLEPLVENAPMMPRYWHKVYTNASIEISD